MFMLLRCAPWDACADDHYQLCDPYGHVILVDTV